MLVPLERAEGDLVSRLGRAGLSREAATLAIVMATRAHARPESELIDIVAQYPGLEDQATVRNAIKELRSLHWLVDTDSNGAILTHQAPELRSFISDKLGDPTAAARLLQLRASLEPFVTIVGLMKDQIVYSSYLELLRSAQTDIFLPMLATTPNLSSVPILRERAKAGVRVRALLGAPSVVAQIRGETMRSVAAERIREWSRNLAGLANAELRVAYSANDMRFASGMAIDRRLVRLDIYDPFRQRSLEGVMIEIESPGGLELNLVTHTLDVLEDAWRRARPTSVGRGLVWQAQRGWKLWSGLLFGAIALVPVPLHGWFELFIGVSSALVATAIMEAVVALRNRRRRQR